MNNKYVIPKLSAIAVSILLASCGGGGSDGYYNNGSGSGNTGQEGGSNGIEQPDLSTLNISKVGLYDSANIATMVVTSAGALASVKITDQNGNPVSGALVRFTGESIEFAVSNATVISNAAGEASIAIKPVGETTSGSFKISASAEFNDKTADSGATFFTIEPIKTELALMSASASLLEAGGTTNISLITREPDTKAIQHNVKVDFDASCGSFDSASVLSANQGNVLTTYSAIDASGKLCTGGVTINALTNNGNVKNSVNITVNAAKANSLVYNSSEVKLGTSNSGSASSGQLEFTVYADKVPALDQKVRVEIVNAPSDLNFVKLGNRSSQELITNSAGKILVNVYPGSIPGPVEIKATLVSDASVFALTKDVSVATGRATQKGLSLSVTKNALQWDVDGDKATIKAMLRDRVGNKVPDKTVISFITEGGSITPSCSTVDGECSVVLQTQNPRPADNRVSVLAFVEGDKDYIDKDSDNRYTAGIDQLTHNIGDFFRDDNENNIFEAALGEFLYKRGAIGNTCAPSTIAQPNIMGTCNNELEAVIREQMIFAFSYDTPTLTEVKIKDKAEFSFKLFGNSALSVPMPSGTTVAVVAEDNTEKNDKTCSAELWSGNATVPAVFNMLTPADFSNSSQVRYTYRIKGCDAGDSLILSVNAPNGQVTKTEYILN